MVAKILEVVMLVLFGISWPFNLIKSIKSQSTKGNNIDLLADTSWIHEVGTSISISRAYTNPVNGVQSIAFCNFVTLHDGTNSRQAILLHILPASEFSQKCFDVPKEQYENVELCIIDANGNYIIKGNVFKNSSFFEFYKSYNNTK